ncbi:hypothetical protein BZG36_00766 [Bifiguratus adelaidae]|uniref:ADP-ribosylation factor-like protein 8B n=1 Tax=Bifiguratus adelaidae TaxID=1938954 RepID=A0A261Y6J5_9FUNG|nr:hypothetical protein BZG36_00766 [Bifiguratus adelaidae]
MAAILQSFWNWLMSFFWKDFKTVARQPLSISLRQVLMFILITYAILPYLCPSILQSGEYIEDQIPTVGFNMRKVVKGNVTMKLWDVGGQPRFRNMWERYCRGVNAIVFVVDAADHDKIEAAKTELKALLDKPQLAGIPVLVLGNKNDLPGCMGVNELIEQMNLKAIANREVSCYSISAKNSVNIDLMIQWLIKKGKDQK